MPGNLGRQPVTIVEIDFGVCSRVFGVGGCPAALSASVKAKCVNTFATCRATSAYSARTQTLRFAMNDSGLPKGMTIFPALQSVSSRGAEINLSGIDPRTSALGKRARVTVELQDFTYHDGLTDPYRDERISGTAQWSGVGYVPESRGSFFGRLLARQPYYIGLPLRVLRGYVGDDLGDMISASYVISEWSGPDATGRVQIVAKDILDLAENTKAVAPAASRGKLAAAITATDTVAVLTPAGVGAEYAASGRLCIGREIVTFARSGDVLTLTNRGVDGSAPEAHAANDVAQQCLRYSEARICDVIYDLLVTHAGINPAWIDLAAWRAANDDWTAGIQVVATIAKPTGVATLIGELQQLGVMVWWEETAQQLRFAVNRPIAPGETAYAIGEAGHIITGTPEAKRGDDQRISQLLFWHGVINPAETTDDEKNFSKLVVAGADSPYAQDQIKTIFCRWFGQIGDDTAASVIAERLAARYQIAPRTLSVSLDVKDRALKLGDLITAQTRVLQDEFGAQDAVTMQVKYVEISDSVLMLAAEEFGIEGRFGYLMQDPQGDYDTASDAEKADGAFLMDEAIGTFPDGTGPYVIF